MGRRPARAEGARRQPDSCHRGRRRRRRRLAPGRPGAHGAPVPRRRPVVRCRGADLARRHDVGVAPRRRNGSGRPVGASRTTVAHGPAVAGRRARASRGRAARRRRGGLWPRRDGRVRGRRRWCAGRRGGSADCLVRFRFPQHRHSAADGGRRVSAARLRADGARTVWPAGAGTRGAAAARRRRGVRRRLAGRRPRPTRMPVARRRRSSGVSSWHGHAVVRRATAPTVRAASGRRGLGSSGARSRSKTARRSRPTRRTSPSRSSIRRRTSSTASP